MHPSLFDQKFYEQDIRQQSTRSNVAAKQGILTEEKDQIEAGL